MQKRPLTRKALYQAGKALRQKTPREAHASLPGERSRDAVAVLAQDDDGRVAHLIPERYKRMLASPFAFLRGAAALMAEDLARAPMAGALVQACGDCHLMNFGAFVTPEDNIIFDINDFDETLPGVDFTVDLKRLAASVAVAALDAGASKKRARAIAAQTVRAYREQMHALMRLTPLDIWHASVDLEAEAKMISNAPLRRKLGAIIARARGARLVRDDNFPHVAAKGRMKIADKPPTIYHVDGRVRPRERVDAVALFSAYQESLRSDLALLARRYRLRDSAFKAVGVGSIGTYCGIGLFADDDGETIFLQFKEARRSVLERIDTVRAWGGPQGERVIQGQRLLQAASDLFLGTASDAATERDFYVRALKNRRLGSISEIAESTALGHYARLCGLTLANAHARSGDPAAIAGYMGRSKIFDKAIAEFAIGYADRNAADFAALTRARKSRGAAPTKRARKAR